MKLSWSDPMRTKGDLGVYEIVTYNGKTMAKWTPDITNDKGFRVCSLPRDTIEELHEVCQLMEDDMTGISIMTDQRWNAFLSNCDLHTKEVFS